MTIERVGPDGKTVVFTSALQFQHYGCVSV